jgi:hypothetical protein
VYQGFFDPVQWGKSFGSLTEEENLDSGLCGQLGVQWEVIGRHVQSSMSSCSDAKPRESRRFGAALSQKITEDLGDSF